MNATETDCIVNVNNIYKNFGALQVLKGVSCRVKKGERIVLIGPSGSGKSTLLRCMNLLEKPTYGEVWLDGKLVTPVDPYLHPEIIEKSKTYAKMLAAGEIEKSELVHEIKAKDLLHEKHEGAEYNKAIKSLYKENVIDINLARRKMGMVFQHFNLFNNLTVMQNMTLAPVKLKLKTKEEAEQSALKLLQRIGLEDKKDVYPSTLSGGQKQRLTLAVSDWIDTPVLILDEPTSGLDFKNMMRISEHLKALAQKGKTILIITHDYEFAAMTCNRVLHFVDEGHVETFPLQENLSRLYSCLMCQ